MDQNSIKEEIRSRFEAGNSCYHLMLNILFFSLLSENMKIKTYRYIILTVVCMGVKLGRSHWRRNVG